MNDYRDVYTRLYEYYKLLSNNPEQGFDIDENFYYGISISRINELTNIPIDIIRKDIATIYAWKMPFDYDDDILENELADIFDDALDSPEEFEQLLSDGTFDELPIHLLLINPTYYIRLSKDEGLAYYNNPLLNQATNSHVEYEAYRIKESYKYHHINNLTEKLEIINSAISHNKCIKIDYLPPREDRFSTFIKPLKLIYDSAENLYYVLTIVDNAVRVYRLDRILHIMEANIQMDADASNILEIAPNVWGCCFSDEPYKVKVRFYNEGNVFNKVRKDLSYRTNAKLYELDGFLYYEDIVYGLNSFRTWIYSYGSSAVVLEPTKLREEIIESLKIRLSKIKK